MPAGTYNIICDQGATFSRSLFYGDDDGAAKNLDGYTARMEVRTPAGILVCALTTAAGSIVLGGDAGTIDLIMTAEATATLPLGRHTHTLVLTGAIVDLVARGTFYVRAGVAP